jgi:hypothetical protein
VSAVATEAPPALRQILLDALDDAYWYRKDEIEGCRDCPRQPAGICADHEDDNALASYYETARKQLEQAPDSAEVLAALLPAAAEGGEQS